MNADRLPSDARSRNTHAVQNSVAQIPHDRRRLGCPRLSVVSAVVARRYPRWEARVSAVTERARQHAGANPTQ